MTTDYILRLRDVSVHVNDVDILKGIDMGVAPGEVVALFGESGSGKSTLIDVVGGNVQYSGVVERSAGLDEDRVGMLYDPLATFPELRVGDVLKLYRDIRECPLNDRLVHRFRLDEVRKRRVRVLSAGERKRLGVYLALFAEPDLAVLDEPTNGLDPMLRRVFWQTVAERVGATLLATHLWEEALRAHDRICLLAGGRMLGSAKPLASWLSAVPYRGKVTLGQGWSNQWTFRGKSYAMEDGTVALYYVDEAERAEALKIARRNAANYVDSAVSIEDVYMCLREGVST